MDNKWRVCVILIGGLFGEIVAFNVDLEFPVVFRSTDDDYFGYSVALHRNRNGPMALVTAPRANSTYESSSLETGALFACLLSNPNSTCEEVNLGSGDEKKNPLHLRDNMWLGVSLDVQQGSDENNIVVCGHLWKINDETNKNNKEYNLNGICYVINQELDKRSLKTLLPFLRKDKQIIKDNKGKAYYFFAFGQVGFSAAFSETGQNLLLGAPGYFNWIGTAVNYNASDFVDAVYAHQKDKPPFNSYIGYSITSGKFFGGDAQYIALGAPRGGNDHGEVYLIEPLNKRNRLFNVRQKKEGKRLGEYFGAAVMATNLNNDKFSDLLVGAPFFSTNSNADEGKVYVFMGSEKGLQEYAELYGGNKPLARFGMCIAHIGDLNQDGFNDVAVGAPYEEDQRGAVYIYHGTNAGIDDQYKQRIRAEDVDRGLKGFGISISRGLDIDNNHYPDFLIGSYASNNAILFKTRPVIQVTAQIDINPQQINTNATRISHEKQVVSINVESCLKYSGNHTLKDLDFFIELSMDANRGTKARRGYFMVNNQTSYNIEKNATLSVDTEKCFEEQAYVFADTEDIINAIPFLLKIELRRNASQDIDFCKTCPVFDPRYSKSVVKFVPFQKNCGEDDICQADIVVDAVIDETESNSPVIIGEKKSLTLSINITNQMEPAYSSELSILLPSETAVVNQDFCSVANEEKEETNAKLKCDLGNPMKTNDMVYIKIKIDISKLPASIETMNIYLESTTTSTELDEENNRRNISVFFKAVADIEITGASEDEHILYDGLDGGDDLVSIDHTYFVRNFGPSPLRYINIELHIPAAVYGETGQIDFLNITDLEVNNDESFPSPAACYYTSINPRAVGFQLLEMENSDSFQCNSNAPNGNRKSSSKTELLSEKKMIGITDSSKLNVPSHSGKGENETTTFIKNSKIITINCETTSCVAIHCCVNPSVDTRKTSKIKIRGKMNVTAIERLSLRPWSRIEFSTQGKIYVKGEKVEIVSQSNRAHEISVKTIVCRRHLPPAEVANWVIFLSIGIGIFLLVLIVIALIKFGFFKRQRAKMMTSAVLKKDPKMNDDDGK